MLQPGFFGKGGSVHLEDELQLVLDAAGSAGCEGTSAACSAIQVFGPEVAWTVDEIRFTGCGQGAECGGQSVVAKVADIVDGDTGLQPSTLTQERKLDWIKHAGVDLAEHGVLKSMCRSRSDGLLHASQGLQLLGGKDAIAEKLLTSGRDRVGVPGVIGVDKPVEVAPFDAAHVSARIGALHYMTVC